MGASETITTLGRISRWRTRPSSDSAFEPRFARSREVHPLRFPLCTPHRTKRHDDVRLVAETVGGQARGGLRMLMNVMNVEAVMTKDPKTCTPETTVAEAAHLMWEADCGILPVVDQGKIIGIVTDRDMYIALATRNVLPSVLTVGSVATGSVVTCCATDSVHDALSAMKQARVRRLPVVDAEQRLVGVLSIDDIVLAAAANKNVKKQEVFETLESVCVHHPHPPAVLAVI